MAAPRGSDNLERIKICQDRFENCYQGVPVAVDLATVATCGRCHLSGRPFDANAGFKI